MKTSYHLSKVLLIEHINAIPVSLIINIMCFNKHSFLQGLSPELVPPILPTIPSPRQYGYRTKITPHFDIPPKRFRKENQGETRPWEVRIGFGEKGRRSVIDIEVGPMKVEQFKKQLDSRNVQSQRLFLMLHYHPPGDTFKSESSMSIYC